MDRGVLLKNLPPYSNRSVTIRKNQNVKDIVREVLAADEYFAKDYDLIAGYFDASDNLEIAKKLFAFLKKNVRYKIESEKNQTTKSPSAILVTAQGDCKHYASFINGVFGALRRQGRNINFCYRFASYSMFDKTPGHVFAVLFYGGNEIWIDPVLNTFNERLQPTYILDEKPNNFFMLQRVSGIQDGGLMLDYEDQELSPELIQAIALLYNYRVMDEEGRVNDSVLTRLSKELPTNEFDSIADARVTVQTAAVGGFFADLWRGTKKVTLAPPRNAFLSLVALNAFGYATKLKHAIYAADGVTEQQPGQDKLYQKWRSLGGDWNNLKNAVNSGAKKIALLGGAPAVGAVAAAIPAWVATASAVIAAILPLVKEILNSKAVAGSGGSMSMPDLYPYGVCADGVTARSQDGTCTPVYSATGSSNFDFMQFVKDNPLICAGFAAGLYFVLKPNRRN